MGNHPLAKASRNRAISWNKSRSKMVDRHIVASNAPKRPKQVALITQRSFMVYTVLEGETLSRRRAAGAWQSSAPVKPASLASLDYAPATHSTKGIIALMHTHHY